jgi:hypothetical protein
MNPVEPEDWLTKLRRMHTHRHELAFSYLGMEVGVFEGPELPSAPGRYQYAAYRGPGHYELACALERGERPRCNFNARPEACFTVLSASEGEGIELSDFDVTSSD